MICDFNSGLPNWKTKQSFHNDTIIDKHHDCFKSTSIISVFKKDDPIDKENHRPVRTLPLLSKVFK